MYHYVTLKASKAIKPEIMKEKLIMKNYKRQQEITAAQAAQKLINAAKVVAYATGCYDGGWLVEASGSIDGFKSDYCFVHSNPGNIVCHRVHTIHVLQSDRTEHAEYLTEVLDACAAEHDGEKPEVTDITDSAIDACKAALKKAYNDTDSKGLAEWLEQLFGHQLDESACDFDRLAEELDGALPVS